MSSPHSKSPKDVVDELKSHAESGLPTAEVQARQRQYGRNEIPAPPPTSFWKLVLDQFQDTLVLILLGAAVISFILALFEEGEDRATAFIEPAVILIILILNATVGVVQESNAEKAIEVCVFFSSFSVVLTCVLSAVVDWYSVSRSLRLVRQPSFVMASSSLFTPRNSSLVMSL